MTRLYCTSFPCRFLACKDNHYPDQYHPEPDTVSTFVKHDQGKLRMDLIPPEFLEALARALTHGAAKYSPDNWRKGAAYSRYYGALLRHLVAFWGGEDTDKDSGLHHLDCASACLAFLTVYAQQGLGTDDRPGAEP